MTPRGHTPFKNAFIPGTTCDSTYGLQPAHHSLQQDCTGILRRIYTSIRPPTALADKGKRYIQRTRLSGIPKQYRDKTGTFYTGIRYSGIPRNAEPKVPIFDFLGYRIILEKNTVMDFERRYLKNIYRPVFEAGIRNWLRGVWRRRNTFNGISCFA